MSRSPHTDTAEVGSRSVSRAVIAGIPWPYFLICAALVAAAGVLGEVPDNLVGGFTVCMVFGGFLSWLGNHTPYLKNFGLSAIACTLLPAFLLFAGILPTRVADVMENWTSGYGFIDFFIASLIAGSILSMPRQLLLKVGFRFAVPVVCAVIVSFVLVSLLGGLLGFGVREAVLFIAAPVTGGGIGAGAVPLSQMYATALGGDAGDYLSRLLPSVVIANTVAIFIAGVYNGLSRSRRRLFIGFDGEGRLLRKEVAGDVDQVPPERDSAFFSSMAAGIVVAGTLYFAGLILAHFVPAVHGYAWTILLAALIKIFDLLPEQLEQASDDWYSFVSKSWVPALLVGCSIAYIDVGQLLGSFTDPIYVLLTLAAILIIAGVAGLTGWLCKMYFLEASVTAGLNMADMGSDIPVLSAANRVNLLPFSQMTSRLGGAFVLFLVSALLPLLARL
ncbi:2-hydroxycarboxylate transporter family protein [Brevibacterium oceani]|uniref:2-hydroxycarboxylate transporter family protein n=1 Tax=Brevibacterium oceani TaxID=358099 RepID=UPI001B33CA67|nr:2-hydroxycarboxylate transporter family protein [Brevibacterium oceani]